MKAAVLEAAVLEAAVLKATGSRPAALLSRPKVVVSALVALLAVSCGTVDRAADCAEPDRLERLELDLDPRAPFGSEHAILWIPGCVDLDRAQLVVLLHGSTQSPDLWFDPPVEITAIASTLDRSDRDTIVVAPGGADGGPFFVEFTWQPLLDRIETDLGGLPPIAAIGGFSAGGNATARLAFGPDRTEVRRVGLWAPAWARQFDGWIEDELADTSIEFIHLDAGDRDGLGTFFPGIEAAIEASNADVTVRIDRESGGHRVEYVAERIDDWLRLLASGSTDG